MIEIRDVVHGAILVDNDELAVIDSRAFQRLRQIKQLGFAENSYPSATHNRYTHSLGAMAVASRALDSIFESPELPTRAHQRFRKVLRLATLLHDVGHGPLSHTTEFAMPKRMTHEDYTLKFILDSELTPAIEAAGKPFGFDARHVAALVDSTILVNNDFFIEPIEGKPTDFRPFLHQIVSSELDADRMDYLKRDSLHAGVSYGEFDFDWLARNLTAYAPNGKCHLALRHRALYAFEDFLLSRYHMFLMVYFHYKSVVYDEMLAQYFKSADCDYSLPSDIERYTECNDAHLHSHLAASQNPWARRITEKRPYRVLIELHSGIPATKTATEEQALLLEELKTGLNKSDIHFLEVTSTSELSKYFQKPAEPIFIRYDNHYSAPSFIPLAQCTDMFQKYSEKRSITRLYVSPEDLPRARKDRPGLPLRYEAS